MKEETVGKVVQHIKSKNGMYLGTLVGLATGDGYNVGWSKFHYEMENPLSAKNLRHKGFEIAYGRAACGAVMYDKFGQPKYPYSFTGHLYNFIERCDRYFKCENPDNIN